MSTGAHEGASGSGAEPEAGGTGRDLHEWAGRAWPEHDWAAATVAHGAFHEVVLLPSVVARVAIGDRARQRTEREASLLTAVTALQVPVATPTVVGTPVTIAGRCGQRTTRVVGEHREEAGWPEVREEFAALLGALAEVPVVAEKVGTAADWIPTPRHWCGGVRWSQLVAE